MAQPPDGDKAPVRISIPPGLVYGLVGLLFGAGGAVPITRLVAQPSVVVAGQGCPTREEHAAVLGRLERLENDVKNLELTNASLQPRLVELEKKIDRLDGKLDEVLSQLPRKK